MSTREPVTSWGRWGADDELGAMNQVAAEQVLAGLAEAVTGRVVSLATPIRNNQGFGLVGRRPAAHYMVRSGADYAAGLPERAGFGYADDVIAMPTQGATHVDALAHVWRDHTMYNGFSAREVTGRGARRLGIDKMPPLVTRGVVVDASAHREPVRAERLQQLLHAQDVRLRPGDALLVRTGWLAAALRGDADGTRWPGLHPDCGDLLAGAGITLIGADNPGVEAFPSPDPACQVPLHVQLLRDHGIYFSELMALDELCAARRPTFLFVLAPLPLVGAVGSPVSPVAVL
ncbi:cyclase family protein [Acrocarpospora macrocephala]|uniref:cyclase family protein n=1 Tax=Acrocarpospora macrocephala TaxID=150177 RepID=UPI001C3F7F7F|nr:cyclase family protein [Acrocarpospora macrocephala]